MTAVNRSREWLGAATVGLWLACVAAVALVRALDRSQVSIHDLACSPEAMAAGRLWTLVTSGFIIAGPPLPQLVMTAAVAIAVVRLAGGRLWWTSAIAGHVGSTFIAYAGIAILYGTDRSVTEGVVHAPDYGISAVWAATIGTLLVVLHRRGAHPRITAACTIGLLGAFLALVGVDGELADVEHLLAFLIGLGVAAVVRSPSGELATVLA